MLKIKPPAYRYCPFCGNLLKEKLEEGQVRKYCPTDKWTYYPTVFIASVAMVTKKGKVLLVKRNREPYKNTWMLPAGFLDYGEHPEEAVIREVKEETNLNVEKLGLFGIFQGADDSRAPGVLLIAYEVKAKGKINNSDPKENNDIDWFSPKNPPKIGWRSHKKILRLLQEKLLNQPDI